MTQSIKKQVGTLTTIESKLHLCEIGRKVLRADFVPCLGCSAFGSTVFFLPVRHYSGDNFELSNPGANPANHFCFQASGMVATGCFFTFWERKSPDQSLSIGRPRKG